MYWKKGKWIAMTALSALWLTACGTDTDTDTTGKNNGTNIEETNETDSPATPDKPSFTLEQAIEQSVTTFAYIMDVFTEAGISQNINEMTISEELYEELKPSFSTYATEHFIENGLKAIAQDYCNTCENPLIPQNPTCAFTSTLEVISAEEVRLISKYNRNMPDGQAEQEIITFKFENDQWKVDEAISETISLDLDVETAALIFETESYTNVTFKEEVMLSVEGGSDEVVYIFETNEGTYAITQNDGYIVPITE